MLIFIEMKSDVLLNQIKSIYQSACGSIKRECKIQVFFVEHQVKFWLRMGKKLKEKKEEDKNRDTVATTVA